ncbi:MAG: PRA1 family protein [bacterium]
MTAIWGLLGIGVGLAAFAAILLGRNLTHSLTAAQVFVVALLLWLPMSGVGTVAWLLGIGALAVLGLLQVFGWMLVDVDRDHLPPTEPATRVARGLAFALLGGAIALLGILAADELTSIDGGSAARPGPALSAAVGVGSGAVGVERGASMRSDADGPDSQAGAAADVAVADMASGDAAAIGAQLFGSLQPLVLLLGLAIAAALLSTLLLLRDDESA